MVRTACRGAMREEQVPLLQFPRNLLERCGLTAVETPASAAEEPEPEPTPRSSASSSASVACKTGRSFYRLGLLGDCRLTVSAGCYCPRFYAGLSHEIRRPLRREVGADFAWFHCVAPSLPL